ncbi:hypothetical protein BGY98DRAFT_979889 [Russula aff. rugulosa BPL654]|nr:hypothetical protein BGY98DRAFT_979889 [Russula aff. rugulosa BPL654]
MLGLNGVPSKPFACCLVTLALPGLVWPVWLLCGIPVTAVIEAYIEASPPCIVLLELGYIPRTVSDRKETIWRGTYRQLSLPPRLVQIDTPAPVDRVPSKNISASSTWPVVSNGSTKSSFVVDHGAADASKPTTSQSRSKTTKKFTHEPCGARPKEIVVTTRELLRVAVPVVQERNQLVLE